MVYLSYNPVRLQYRFNTKGGIVSMEPSAARVMLDYPYTEQTKRTRASDALANHLISLAERATESYESGQEFVVNIPYVHYDISLSELIKSLAATNESAGDRSFRFISVHVNGVEVVFQRH